jgi:hypothetical protein
MDFFIYEIMALMTSEKAFPLSWRESEDINKNSVLIYGI